MQLLVPGHGWLSLLSLSLLMGRVSKAREILLLYFFVGSANGRLFPSLVINEKIFHIPVFSAAGAASIQSVILVLEEL